MKGKTEDRRQETFDRKYIRQKRRKIERQKTDETEDGRDIGRTRHKTDETKVRKDIRQKRRKTKIYIKHVTCAFEWQSAENC